MIKLIKLKLIKVSTIIINSNFKKKTEKILKKISEIEKIKNHESHDDESNQENFEFCNYIFF